MIGSEATIEMLDIHGRPTRTTRPLLGYASYVRQQMLGLPAIRFINATEGGILGAPAEPMPLSTAMRSFLSDPIDVSVLQPLAPPGLASTSRVLSAARSRLAASARFLESFEQQIETLAASPLETALRSLEDVDRTLKTDRRVYDLYWLLERQAVWRFERQMKRLQRSERTPKWLGEIIAGYSDFYRVLRDRARWIIDLLEK
jgi:hypothetical protein